MDKIKILQLDLDAYFGDAEYPSTEHDIYGLGHFITINAEDKEKVINEMVNSYREMLEEGFEEIEDEEDDNDFD